MKKVGFERYKEWVDSLLEECTEENKVKGKDLELIRSTMPENMGTEVYKLGNKSDDLLYVYIERNEDDEIRHLHLYVYKEIAEESKFIEQPFFCYYKSENKDGVKSENQHGKKMELVQFTAPGFVAQYNRKSNKDFFFYKDATETSEQNSSEKPIDIDKIIDKLPTEFKDLYCRIKELYSIKESQLRKKLTSILRAEALKKEMQQEENLKG